MRNLENKKNYKNIIDLIKTNQKIYPKLKSNIINTLNYQNNLLKELRGLAKRYEGSSANLDKLIDKLKKSNIQNTFAKNIQSWIFPTNLPNNNSLSVFVNSIPFVGTSGDFYDVVEMIPGSNIYGVFLADVSGHGVSAALTTIIVKLLLSNAISKYFHPKDIMSYINDELCRLTKNKSYMTSVFLVIDLRNSEIIYTSAGHPYCVRYNSVDNKIEEFETKGGTVIGFVKSLKYKEYKLVPNKNDKIIIYTDGLTEMKNKSGEMFGEEKLYNLIREHIQAPTNELAEIIKNGVKKFGNKNSFCDDVTLIIIDIKEAKSSKTSSSSSKLYLTKNETTKLIDYYKRNMKSKKEKDDLKGVVEDLRNLSYHLLTKGFYEESKKYIDEAEEKIKNIDNPKLKGNVYHTKSLYYKKTGDSLDKYKEYNQKALKQYLIVNDKEGIVGIYISLSIYSGMTGNLNDAKKYSLKALETLKALDSNPVTRSDKAIVYNNLGVSYYLERNIDKGLEYFHKCLELCERDNVLDLQCTLLSNIADIYILKCKYEKALKYLRKTLLILEEIEDIMTLSIVYSNMGNIFFKIEDYNLALYYITKSIRTSEENNIIDYAHKITALRSYIFLLIGELSKSIKDIKKYISIKKDKNKKNYDIFIYLSVAKILTMIRKENMPIDSYEELEEIIKHFNNKTNPVWYFEKLKSEKPSPSEDFGNSYCFGLCEYALFLHKNNSKNKAKKILNELRKEADKVNEICSKRLIGKTLNKMKYDS